MGEISRKLMAWLRSLSTETAPDPEPVNAKPERNMREEIMRRTAAIFGGGPNRGEVSKPRQDSPEEFMRRYHKLRNS